MTPGTDSSARKRLLQYWGPTIAWALFAWVLSTSLFSDEQTSRFIMPWLKWLLPDATPRTLLFLHKLIRKAAHVGVYFIFSLLLFRAVRGERKGWEFRWAAAAVAIAAGYAVIDEAHQFFAAGRGSSIRDTLLDTVSAILAQLTVWWGLRLRFFSGAAKAPQSAPIDAPGPTP